MGGILVRGSEESAMGEGVRGVGLGGVYIR